MVLVTASVSGSYALRITAESAMKILKKIARSISKRLSPNRDRLNSRDRATVFSAIYADKVWTVGTSNESLSGDGSTMQATVATRATLTRIIQAHGVRSFLDAPCGDFNWMRHLPMPGVRYTGADIVQSVVDENNRLFASEQRRFVRLDLVEQVPEAHDLVLCRDCIMHLPNADVQRLLANISASGSKFMLITVHPRLDRNDEIDRVGGYRGVNLRLPPFGLPEPIECVPDGSSDRAKFDRWLALYRLPLNGAKS